MASAAEQAAATTRPMTATRPWLQPVAWEQNDTAALKSV
jgi:hypothetical protein